MTEHRALSEAAYRQYLDGLLAGDRDACRRLFRGWLDAGMELHTLYEDVVRRSLYEVGTLWEQGRITVAAEHLATAITESLLPLSYDRLFATPRNGKSAVIACTANEYHQIGGKMVADLFELHGWRGHFLGANTPLADLLSLVGQKHPDVVALSVSVAFSLDTLAAAIEALRHTFPTLPILVGGQAFRYGGMGCLDGIADVHFLSSTGELIDWIRRDALAA